ncbi:lens fiber major intrinsic protein-like isoform X2 [Dermacentor albipictus]|uniref:lens fiber major intrinsic protein-like isoform X2 n=1 Tax=Dermacentor albipictus TaxID=60249 RepID=UPI0038FCD7C6
MRRLMDSLPEEPPPCRRELASGPLWRRVFVELLGSLLFTVFTVPLQPRRQQADGGPLQCSVAMGASAAALAHCLAGDLNPAVTLSRLVGRRLSVVRALLCVAAQCSGACLGAAALYGLVPRDQRPAQQPPQQLAQGLHASQAFGVEFLGTVLVALSALAADRAASGPLGVAYAAAALFAVYWAGPMLGGLMAGFTHEYTRGARLGREPAHSLRPSPPAGQPARSNHVKRDISGLSNDTELTLTSNNDCRV